MSRLKNIWACLSRQWMLTLGFFVSVFPEVVLVWMHLHSPVSQFCCPCFWCSDCHFCYTNRLMCCVAEFWDMTWVLQNCGVCADCQRCNIDVKVLKATLCQVNKNVVTGDPYVHQAACIDEVRQPLSCWPCIIVPAMIYTGTDVMHADHGDTRVYSIWLSKSIAHTIAAYLQGWCIFGLCRHDQQTCTLLNCCADCGPEATAHSLAVTAWVNDSLLVLQHRASVSVSLALGLMALRGVVATEHAIWRWSPGVIVMQLHQQSRLEAGPRNYCSKIHVEESNTSQLERNYEVQCGTPAVVQRLLHADLENIVAPFSMCRWNLLLRLKYTGCHNASLTGSTS